MEKNKSNKPDVFKEALADSAKNIIKGANEIQEITDKELPVKLEDVDIEQQMLALQHSKEGDKWDNLSKYMSGEGSERLLLELKKSPGKDFVRNYLKALEHFKPKLMRSEIAPASDMDRTINIQIVQVTKDGGTRVVGIDGGLIVEGDSENTED